MTKHSRLKRGNSFAKNAMLLVGSNTLAQIISVLSSIVLGRLYSPAEMGLYSNYVAITSIITVISCLQYERAIVLGENEEEANRIISICFRILALFVLTIILVVFLFRKIIASLLNSLELEKWIILLPISIVALSTMNITLYNNMRRNTMRIVVVTNLIAIIVATGFQIFFGISLFHIFGGMILGRVIGNVSAGCYSIFRSIPNKKNLLGLKRRRLKCTAIKFREFPQYSVPSTLFNTLGASAPNLVLSGFFGQSVTGYYGMSYRLLSLPISVVSGSISQAYLPQAVESNKKNNLSNSVLNILSILAKVDMVPLILIAIAAPDLIAVVFGEIWRPAGVYARWLCVWLFFSMLYSPLSNLFIVLEKQKEAMYYNIIALLTKVITICIGGIIGDPLLSIVLFCVGGMCVAIYGCCIIFRLSNVNINDAVSILFKQLVSTIPYIILPLFAAIINYNCWVTIGISVLFGAVFVFKNGKELIVILKKK